MHKEELVRKVPLLPYHVQKWTISPKIAGRPKRRRKKKVNIEDGGVKLKLFIKL